MAELDSKQDQPKFEEALFAVPESELECVLCYKLLYEPITTPTCGHTFCRLCLARALETKRQCPLCREPCNMDPLSHATTALLANLLDKCAGDAYKARKTEGEIERKQRRVRMGIFYALGPTFPGARFDLHIFEPRYRVMVNNALATNRRFLYVEEGRDLGCIVKILRCQAIPDGRSFMQCEAESRVRLSNIGPEDNGYGLHTADVTEIVDEAEDADEQARLHELCTLIDAALVRYCQTLTIGMERLQLLHGQKPGDPKSLSFWLCRMLQSTARPDLLYDCFEANKVSNRLGLCLNMLDEAIHSAKQSSRRRVLLLLLFVLAVVLYKVMQRAGWLSMEPDYPGEADVALAQAARRIPVAHYAAL